LSLEAHTDVAEDRIAVADRGGAAASQGVPARKAAPSSKKREAAREADSAMNELPYDQLAGAFVEYFSPTMLVNFEQQWPDQGERKAKILAVLQDVLTRTPNGPMEAAKIQAVRDRLQGPAPTSEPPAAPAPEPQPEHQAQQPAQPTKGRPARFWMPDAIFEQGLTPHELSVYALLARTAGKSRRCWPAIMTIAKLCRMKRDTAISSLDALEGRSMVEGRKRFGKTSVYTLTLPEQWRQKSPNGDNCSSPSNGTSGRLDHSSPPFGHQ
jgi:hypothetical protein